MASKVFYIATTTVAAPAPPLSCLMVLYIQRYASKGTSILSPYIE